MSPEHERLIRKLESIGSLSEDEVQAVLRLPLTTRTIPKDTDLVSEGQLPDYCSLILEGFVCRYKILQRGQRQIMSFHIAGDIPDLQSMFVKTLDHNVGTLLPTKIAVIPHRALRELIHNYPGITNLLWRDTLIDAAVFREWLTSVGRRNAHQRIAHLICEVYKRMQAVGLTDNEKFDFPVTQAEIGDSLGLSTVHVNRVLQDLRKEGLIESRGKSLIIRNWEQLQRQGDFDAAYLQLEPS